MKPNYQFNEETREISLNDPQPERKFENILMNRAYMCQLDQSAQGMGRHMTEEGFTNNVFSGERYIYLRDGVSGDCFSLGFAPCWREPESYECRSGLNYQILRNRTNGLNCCWRIFVPEGEDPVEIWDLEIVNEGASERQIDLFSYAPMPCDGTDTYGGDIFRIADYQDVLDGIFVRQDAELHEKIDFPRHNAFIAGSESCTSYDARQSAFIGARQTLQQPQAVTAGRCTNSHASKEANTGSLHYSWHLAAGEKRSLRIIAGACGDLADALALRQRYSEGGFAHCEHFPALQESNAALCAGWNAEVPEPSVMYHANHWLKQQVLYGAVWTRWGYKGYRDIVQNSQNCVIEAPELARVNLLKACRHQYADGFGLRGWHPVDTMRYADSAQWMVGAVSEYLRETGDRTLLDSKVAFFDEGQATVYEHLCRAMRRLYEDRGSHGLCLAFFGDWNDSLTGVCRHGKGESVWLSQAFCRALLIMAELAEWSGEAADAIRWRQWKQEIADAINLHAWDGRWYLCALDDDGEPIGSHLNEEGKIFLNTQSWSMLGGIATPERWATAQASVEEYLNPGWGLSLNWPVYTKPTPNVGRLSYLRPGIVENGSVYTHGNAFMILAWLEAGQADRALQGWRDIAPGNPARPLACQPNIFANGYFGPDCDIRPGEAEHLWTTGSAGWMYYCLTEGFLGLRRGFDGLRVKPVLPSAWRTASVSRNFRGTHYDVSFANPQAIENPEIIRLEIDGGEVPADTTLPVDGASHRIRVELGQHSSNTGAATAPAEVNTGELVASAS